MRSLSWSDAGEKTLVVAAQAGDAGAFDLLARRYRPAGMLLARKLLRGRDGADDAVQDSLISAYKTLPQLRDPEKFAAWFSSIVRRRSLKERTKPEAREESLADHLDRLILKTMPGIGPDDSPESSIVEVLAFLPEDTREIAHLYYILEWPIAQISELLGLPPSTVKWRLHAARQRLKCRAPHLLEK